MNPFTRKFLIPSTVLLTLSAVQAATAATQQSVNDVRLESQIATSYELNPYLRANSLKVAVLGGNAVLTGKVDEKISKELAGEIAIGVPGIQQVDNRIEVEPTYLPHFGGSTFGNKVDDASISAAIRTKLQWNKDIDSVDTQVSTRNGRVTLIGNADSQQGKDLATTLAMNTRGVTSVTNNLRIQTTPLTQQEKNTMKTNAETHNISDSWITTKVKSSFMYSSNISGSDIDVSTNNGIVTLTGKVASGIERSLAIEIAQNIRGVKSVTSTALVF